MSLVLEHLAAPTDDARMLIAELDAELSGAYAPDQRHGLATFRAGLHCHPRRSSPCAEAVCRARTVARTTRWEHA